MLYHYCQRSVHCLKQLRVLLRQRYTIFRMSEYHCHCASLRKIEPLSLCCRSRGHQNCAFERHQHTLMNPLLVKHLRARKLELTDTLSMVPSAACVLAQYSPLIMIIPLPCYAIPADDSNLLSSDHWWVTSHANQINGKHRSFGKVQFKHQQYIELISILLQPVLSVDHFRESSFAKVQYSSFFQK